MLPSSHPKLLQIFSAKYLEFVPENTLKGDCTFIVNRYIALICLQSYTIYISKSNVLQEKYNKYLISKSF